MNVCLVLIGEPSRSQGATEDGLYLVSLAATVDHKRSQFQLSSAAGGWFDVGPELDASLISDEAGRRAFGSFTGAFVGMVACDMSGGALPADFHRFSYIPL